MSCDVGHRCSLDPTLLWLWCRPAATALIRPLTWECPYGMDAALRGGKKKPHTHTKRTNGLNKKHNIHTLEGNKLVICHILQIFCTHLVSLITLAGIGINIFILSLFGTAIKP